MATILDIDQSTLSKLERNQRKASDEFIEKVSTQFKIDPTELKVCALSDQILTQILRNKHSKEVFNALSNKLANAVNNG